MGSLLDRLKSAGSVKLASVLSESMFFTDKDCTTTKFPILNIALSGKIDGGLTSGITVLGGPSKHFKSLAGLVMVQAYMEKHKDAVCLFFDSEYGITPEYIAANGIDTDRVLHIPVEHLEQLKFDLVKRLEEIKRGDKVIVFVDSIGNLASKKEVEDALDEKSVADMTRAKQVKSFFRIITPHFTTKDIPCIVVAHTYQTQELYSKSVISGGCVKPGTKIFMYDGKLKNVEDIVAGDLVKTLLGPQKVIHTWNPDTLENGTPECYEVEFDDGFKVVCSETHRFLNTDMQWVEAKNLSVGTEIVTL